MPPIHLKVSVRLWWSPLSLEGGGIEGRANLWSRRLCSLSGRAEEEASSYVEVTRATLKTWNPAFEGLCVFVTLGQTQSLGD